MSGRLGGLLGDAMSSTRHVGGADTSAHARVVLVKEATAEPESTLFELVPQYPNEGLISFHQVFRLRHVQSGLWVHFDPRARAELGDIRRQRLAVVISESGVLVGSK